MKNPDFKNAQVLVIALPNEEIRVENPDIVSYISGRSRARNECARKSEAEYLLFFDADTKPVLPFFDVARWLIENKLAFCIEGNNPVFCSRVFGIPRNVFLKVGGLDETFEIGEDIEFGLRLKSFQIPFFMIPNWMVSHKEHARRYDPIKAYVVRSRLIARYKLFKWLLPMRKLDLIAFPLLFILTLRYFLRKDKRLGLKFSEE